MFVPVYFFSFSKFVFCTLASLKQSKVLAFFLVKRILMQSYGQDSKNKGRTLNYTGFYLIKLMCSEKVKFNRISVSPLP